MIWKIIKQIIVAAGISWISYILFNLYGNYSVKKDLFKYMKKYNTALNQNNYKERLERIKIGITSLCISIFLLLIFIIIFFVIGK